MKKERQPLVSLEQISAVHAKYSHKGSGRERRVELENDSSAVMSSRAFEVSLCGISIHILFLFNLFLSSHED